MVLLLLALAAAPRPTPSPSTLPPTTATPSTQAALAALTRTELEAFVEKVSGASSVEARIDAASAAFLGTPYLLGALGEAEPAHPNPLIRFDAVDCVTYVEEVLALSRAGSLEQTEAILQKIRYRGDAVAYVDRNHFMETGWIPSNERKGFVRDITAQVAGKDLVHDRRTYTLAEWRARADARELALPDDRAPVGKLDLAVLPLDRVLAHAADIPDGSILLVAHRSSPRTSNRISHLGFVVRRGGEVFVRHASSKRGRVVEDTLAQFVARDFIYKRWPVSGFLFLQPLPRPAR